jgi:hypothetical protein
MRYIQSVSLDDIINRTLHSSYREGFMKRLLVLATAIGLTILMHGCAIYAPPYGFSTGYYGYAPYYGFGYNYQPYSYYSYRPYPHGGDPGYRGWGGGRHWGSAGRWHGGGGGHWGGHGGWHGR